MTSLPKSTMHPEIGPRNSVGVVDRPTGASGTIVFNQRPLSTGDPAAIIKEAIVGGDTTARRFQQFHEAMNPPEQK